VDKVGRVTEAKEALFHYTETRVSPWDGASVNQGCNDKTGPGRGDKHVPA